MATTTPAASAAPKMRLVRAVVPGCAGIKIHAPAMVTKNPAIPAMMRTRSTQAGALNVGSTMAAAWISTHAATA